MKGLQLGFDWLWFIRKPALLCAVAALVCLAAHAADATPNVPLRDWGKTYTALVPGGIYQTEFRSACSQSDEDRGVGACFNQGAPAACGRGCILWAVNCGVEYIGRGATLIVYECVWHTPPPYGPGQGGGPRPMWDQIGMY